jgi:hypothetical protein
MRCLLPKALLGGSLILLLLGLSSTPAYAHGFGQRYDLPVPLWLYVAGAGAAVALSFVVIGLFVGGRSSADAYPRFNLLRWPWGRALLHRALVLPLQVLAVALFLLVILTGFFGDQDSTNNLAPTMIWVIWWVGIAYTSALIGNVWALVNPWKIIFGWAEALYKWLNPEGDLSMRKSYPAGLGVWPALLLFLAFAWAEIVFTNSAVPASIARMAVVYSIITWSGMAIFGREQWLRHGEAFSLAFGFLARFAPTELRVTDHQVCDACSVECRDKDGHCISCSDCLSRANGKQRELNLRPFAVGLLGNEAITPSMVAFVVLLLSTVTFDGFTATPLWADIHSPLASAFSNDTAASTFGLLVFPLIFVGVYLGFMALMAITSGNRIPVGGFAPAFVFSLVPIALAYHLAHFLSFLLVQGQLIIPLASDPFGAGWDLIGTVDYRVNIAIINARIAWFIAVGTIVIGHIVSVYLAHIIALRTLKERRLALRSQYPMLGLMVGYTMLSLWILAQPIVET